MPAEHARELAIVAMLLASALGAEALGAHELAASLGGAALALILPRTGTAARVALVGACVGLSMTLSGCASTPTPWKVAETACDVVRVASMACGLVPSSSGGESP